MDRTPISRSFWPWALLRKDWVLTWLPLVTALLLCICLTTESNIVLSCLSLVPFAYVFVARRLPRAAYASAYLAGLAIHLVGMAWVLECYRYENAYGPYVVQWFWIGTWGGSLFVCLLAGGRFLYQRQPIPMTLLLPTLWVAFEFIRHEMAEIVTGTGFPWLKLGTSVVDSRYLVQVADLGGEYLLSFLVVMISGAIVDSFHLLFRTNLKGMWFATACSVAVAAVLVIAAQGYGVWRIGQSTGEIGPTVGLLGELDLPPLLDKNRLRDGLGSEATQARKADLLLWPELAYHHRIIDDHRRDNSKSALNRNFLQVRLSHQSDYARASRYLEQTSCELRATLVIGCERQQFSEEKSAVYNSMACVDPVHGYQGCYDKVNLVPGAEASMRSTEAFHGDKFVYGRGDGYRVFSVPTEGGCYRFATAICYDLCFGQHFQRRSAVENSSSRPDFLVQCGAEGQDSRDVVATRMLRYARLRAIENRRSLVRNATFGYSALIDGNGDIQTVLPTAPIQSPKWLGAVPIDRRFSFYAIAGEWIAYSSCAVLVFLLVSKPSRKHASDG